MKKFTSLTAVLLSIVLLSYGGIHKTLLPEKSVLQHIEGVFTVKHKPGAGDFGKQTGRVILSFNTEIPGSKTSIHPICGVLSNFLNEQRRFVNTTFSNTNFEMIQNFRWPDQIKALFSWPNFFVHRWFCHNPGNLPEGITFCYLITENPPATGKNVLDIIIPWLLPKAPIAAGVVD